MIPPHAYLDEPTFTPADDSRAKTRIKYPSSIKVCISKLDLGHARLTEADVAFLPSLPELAFVGIRLNGLEDASKVEATLKRCPKLKGACRF